MRYRVNRLSTSGGFALDRFNPSERGSEWFSEDTLDLRRDPGGAVGIVGELAIRPLVLYNTDGTLLQTFTDPNATNVSRVYQLKVNP